MKISKCTCLLNMALAALAVLCSTAATARIALVMGNSSYQHAPLSNPLNDARDVAAALRELEFTVTLKENLNRRAMAQAIDAFAAELARTKAVGLFYYAGHGVEIQGVNYLIPLQTDINSEQTVEFESVNVRRLLEQMRAASNKLNIIIIDACRNNPFARSFRRGTNNRGLVRMGAPLGSIIASSTASGNVAADGAFGRNSPYTKHLLRAMRIPNLKIEEVFKEVRRGVVKDTEYQQIPWEDTKLLGDFYFTKREPQPQKAESEINQPVTVVPLVMEPSNQQLVALMQTCRAHFNANRLTTGTEGNALDCYQQVLAQDSTNAMALSGLDAIAERYISWVEQALQQNKPNKAQSYLERLAKVNPKHSKLERLQSVLISITSTAPVTEPVIELEQPDLTVSVDGPDSAKAGEDISHQIRLTVSNQGNTRAIGTLSVNTGGYMVDLVLSTDQDLPDNFASFAPNFSDNVLLRGGRVSNTSTLEAGGMISYPVGAVIPHDTPSGVYCLGGIIDPGGQVTESDEQNNTDCHWINISP